MDYTHFPKVFGKSSLKQLFLCIKDFVQKRFFFFFLLGRLLWSLSAVSLPKEEREGDDPHQQNEAWENEVVAVSTSFAQNHFVCCIKEELVLFDFNVDLDECHKMEIDHQPVDLEEPLVVVVQSFP